MMPYLLGIFTDQRQHVRSRAAANSMRSFGQFENSAIMGIHLGIEATQHWAGARTTASADASVIRPDKEATIC
jgi:hypothetical protein